MRSDDLTPFLGGDDAGDIGLRQGVVKSFDLATGANQVDVGGATLTDLPFLENSGVIRLAAGDVVMLQRWRSSWFIVGRIVPVGSPRFAAASVDFKSFDAYATNFAVPAAGAGGTGGVWAASTTFTVPAWADQMLFTAFASVGAKNTTAGNDILNAFAEVDGQAGSVPFTNVPSLQWFTLAPGVSGTRSVTPGSTITARVRASTSGSNWAADVSNRASIHGSVIFRKSTA